MPYDGTRGRGASFGVGADRAGRDGGRRGRGAHGQKFAPEILKLAEKAARDGEPILRALEYNYPNRGYAGVCDEFMMGTDLLVAPVLEKGAKTRKVALPPGTWRADDGSLCPGDRTIEVSAPIDRLPYFIRTGASNSAHEGTRQAGGESSQVVAYPGLLPAKPADSSRSQEIRSSVF